MAIRIPCAFSLALAGCSSNSEPPPIAEGKEHIACAVNGATALKPVCAVDRIVTGGGLSLIVRHPDGGFRRFDVTQDGSGLVTRDGAEQAVTQLTDGQLDVAVGADRYRFPASEKRDVGN